MEYHQAELESIVRNIVPLQGVNFYALKMREKRGCRRDTTREHACGNVAEMSRKYNTNVTLSTLKTSRAYNTILHVQKRTASGTSRERTVKKCDGNGYLV